MFDFIIFILFFLLFMGLLAYSVIATLKIKKLIKSLFQLNLDYYIITEQIKKNEFKDNEGFINFLTKSRDDAFEYITRVQDVLFAYKEGMDPLVHYHKKFGDVIHTPHKIQIDSMIELYEELLKILPDEPEQTDVIE